MTLSQIMQTRWAQQHCLRAQPIFERLEQAQRERQNLPDVITRANQILSQNPVLASHSALISSVDPEP